jgi:hypothetical protein
VALELDDLYDATTLRRLDRPPRLASSAEVAPRPRRRLAAGVLTGALLGLQEVLEPERAREPVIEVAPDPGAEPVRGVSLFFVPGDPAATVAVVR